MSKVPSIEVVCVGNGKEALVEKVSALKRRKISFFDSGISLAWTLALVSALHFIIGD
jgi:hypothetical protein